MDWLQALAQLVENTSPKHLGQAVKKNKDVFEQLQQACSSWPNLSISEMVRCALYNENPVCELSLKQKRYKSLELGFGFCGRANECECARQRVSQAVKSAKQHINEKQQQQINQKRAATNLAKYGVANVGQTESAKRAHTQLYDDPSRVSAIVAQMQNTFFSKHGVSNPMQLDQVKEKSQATNLAKYGVANFNQLPARKQQLSDTSKRTWEKRKASNFDYHRLNQKFEQNLNISFLTPAEEYHGTVGAIYYRFCCLKCNHQFDDYVYCGHSPVCRICNPAPDPSYSSQQEQDLAVWISSLGVTIEQRNKRLINPYELDIVCHDRKIAIEYCGLYWHSETSSGKNSLYHQHKMQLCENKGYRLVTVFSDEWQFKRKIVEQKISHLLGSSAKRIGARQCKIVAVDGSQARQFLEQNHIQGWAPSAKAHLGLTHNEALVAVMSFSGLRRFTNNAPQANSWELLRYATNANVVGGAGKLLREFEKLYQPAELISFADARWSQGHLYKTLGFELVSKSGAGYWYTRDYQTREHRFSHTKASLVKAGFPASLTEWEIQQSRGYDRIWDCGQYKFVKTYSGQ